MSQRIMIQMKFYIHLGKEINVTRECSEYNHKATFNESMAGFVIDTKFSAASCFNKRYLNFNRKQLFKLWKAINLVHWFATFFEPVNSFSRFKNQSNSPPPDKLSLLKLEFP